MAVTVTKMSAVVVALGVASFVFGILAENKKPPSGVPIPGKGVVICKYPSDPTVTYGYISFGFLVASSLTGFLSVLYPYKGKSVPFGALLKSSTFLLFYNITLGVVGLAAALLLWPTLTAHHHQKHNVHENLKETCPTAKTGLLGGGAFVSLDASLLWLVSLILADNAREDYLEDLDTKSVPAAKGNTSRHLQVVEQGQQSEITEEE